MRGGQSSAAAAHSCVRGHHVFALVQDLAEAALQLEQAGQTRRWLHATTSVVMLVIDSQTKGFSLG